MKVHYYTYLTDDEYTLILKCLIKSGNALLSAGKYTDSVYDVLLKIANAKKKKVRIR